MIAAVEEASIKTYKSFRWPIFMGFCVLLSMLLLRNSTVFIQFTEIYWYLSPMSIAQDPETGDATYKRALGTYVNETTELIHLNIDGEEIVTTPAHPFYVKNIGFVLAGDLEEGTTLVDNEGNELHLLIKRWEQLQCAVPVYNFAVEDYHTYFAGTNNVLVHNNCGAENINLDKAKGYKTFKTLKKRLGSPGEGNEWHHIVEQCQANKRLQMYYLFRCYICTGRRANSS